MKEAIRELVKQKILEQVHGSDNEADGSPNEIIFEDETYIVENAAAIRRIKTKVEEYSKNRKADIIVLQNKEDQKHYTVFVQDSRESYKFEVNKGKFTDSQKLRPGDIHGEVADLMTLGWKRVNVDSWIQRNRTVLIRGLIGASVGGGMAAFAGAPIFYAIAPIIASSIESFGGWVVGLFRGERLSTEVVQYLSDYMPKDG